MPKCEFEKSGAARIVSVDGLDLSFSGGKATRTLSPGEYAVSWFARGDKGDDFSVKVNKPASAAREVKGKIDSSGKDAGTFWMRVSA
jgi:hypothetical protein